MFLVIISCDMYIDSYVVGQGAVALTVGSIPRRIVPKLPQSH